MKFVNLGTRNKPTCWEYLAAHSFLHVQLPGTEFKIPQFFGYGVDKANQHCHEVDVIARNVELIRKEFEAGLYTPDFFANIRSQYQSSYGAIDKLCSRDFTNETNEQLADRFEKVSALIGVSQIPQLMALYTLYLDDYYTDRLKALLPNGEQALQDAMKWKSILLMTTKSSFAQDEEDAMHKVAVGVSQTGQVETRADFNELTAQPEWKTALEELVRDFGWFYMEYHKEPFTVEDYQEHLWSYLQGKDLAVSPQQLRQSIKDQQQEFFAQHPDEEFKNLTMALQEFAFILDNAKSISVKGIFRSRDLYREAARRIGIEEKDLWYLVLPEVTDLLNANRQAEVGLIEVRKHHRAILLENKTLSVYEGKAAQQLAKDLLVEEAKSESLTEVRGLVAYPGQVIGRVVAINSIEDRARFQPGDILVTRDGTVELTMLMKQAGAIITNEGGLICHAAIVAREIKTPCIVGTRNATQIFKDGDVVEVDANKGLVTKITPLIDKKKAPLTQML